jgi:hypothetical protein
MPCSKIEEQVKDYSILVGEKVLKYRKGTLQYYYNSVYEKLVRTDL